MRLNRRTFCIGASATALHARTIFAAAKPTVNVAAIDRERILRAATKYLNEQPVTVTASHSPRSPGGAHDFYSEGDYWWPDPKNPGGPYIRRDGFSNPENFNAHREAMVRLSLQVPALVAAWKLTRDRRYAVKAADHLRAWFVTPETRMTPNLQYAQAIFGVNKGRGIGIIDTLHLVEVARAASFMAQTRAMTQAELDGVHGWFAEYLKWMQDSKNGQDERAEKNNHGSCWVLQAAEFARLTANAEVMDACRERFRTVLIPNQVAADGSLPLELARTKPYSYALFDLDVLTAIAQTLSTTGNNLFLFATADGRGLAKAVAYMAPFIADKSKWPLKPDVEHFDELPARQPSLLFAGLAYGNADYLALWKRLPPDPPSAEGIRNFPIRQPLLWI